jgi:hypothetical protein
MAVCGENILVLQLRGRISRSERGINERGEERRRKSELSTWSQYCTVLYCSLTRSRSHSRSDKALLLNSLIILDSPSPKRTWIISFRLTANDQRPTILDMTRRGYGSCPCFTEYPAFSCRTFLLGWALQNRGLGDFPLPDVLALSSVIPLFARNCQRRRQIITTSTDDCIGIAGLCCISKLPH